MFPHFISMKNLKSRDENDQAEGQRENTAFPEMLRGLLPQLPNKPVRRRNLLYQGRRYA